MREVIRQKLADSLALEPPTMTRREVRLPKISSKARAIIGMRRSGKTWFLWQCLRDRLDAGAAREALVYFSFEDERLAGMESAQLSLTEETFGLLAGQEFHSKNGISIMFSKPFYVILSTTASPPS